MTIKVIVKTPIEEIIAQKNDDGILTISHFVKKDNEMGHKATMFFNSREVIKLYDFIKISYALNQGH